RAMQVFTLLNPANKARTPEETARYRAEPYVVAADVYSTPAHVGRGGWSWYTGSASWMYRIGIEWLLGFQLRGNTLTFNPHIPKTWNGFDITYRYYQSTYAIHVENRGGGKLILELDGV